MNFRKFAVYTVVYLASMSASAQKPTISDLPDNVVTNTRYTVSIGGLAAAGNVTIQVSDPKALLSSTSLAVPANDTATFDIMFGTAGTVTLTITNPVGPVVTKQVVTVSSSSQTAILNCGSCYATVGAGAALASSKYGDYTNPSNVLESTHLGATSPQIAVGLAYKLPFRGIGFTKPLHCSPSSFYQPTSEAQAAFCYPYKAFVSLKISTDSSQTLNGFTYGISHALHKQLDIMIGVSYSAHNEITPGFQAAAVNTVKIQQAAGNPYYAQWDAAKLQVNGPTAFDGFPVQLISSSGVAGALIYTGNPLIVHYHPSAFFGVSIPLSFKSGAAGGS